MRFRSNHLSWAFSEWQCTTEEKRQVIQAMKMAVRVFFHREASQRLYVWRDATKEMERIKGRIQFGMCRIRHLSLTAAHHIWRAVAKEATVLRNNLKKAVFGMIDYKIHWCFQVWKEKSAYLKLQTSLVRRGLSGIRHAAVRICFEEWNEAILRGVRQAQADNKGIITFTTRHLAKALRSLRCEATNGKRQDRLRRGVVMRYIHRTMSSYLEHWRHVLSEYLAEGHSLSRATAAITKRELAKTLELWREISDAIRLHTERVEAIKAGTFVYRVDLAVALNRWKFYSQWSQVSPFFFKLAARPFVLLEDDGSHEHPCW